jgi:hypothetical protein
VNTPLQALEWRPENAKWLRLALRRLRLQLHRHALRCAPNEQRAADWIVASDDAEVAQRTAPGALDEGIEALSVELSQQEYLMLEHHQRPPALAGLAERLGLDELESELLLLAAAPALDGAFALAFAQLHGDLNRPFATLHLALSLHVADPSDRLLAADCLLPGRALRALGLIEVDDAREPLLLRRLAVDERLADYLRGVNRCESRLACLLAPLPAGLPSPSANAAGERVSAAVTAAEERWSTINLIGQLERGAADVVQLACQELQLWPRLLDLGRYAAQPPAERAELLSLLGREAVLANMALVVDGARAPGQADQVAAVDELLASLSATLFLISHERWPGSRDAVTLRVPAPTRQEQRQLWAAALNGHGLEMADQVDAIVQQFNFGSPAIHEVVTRAGREGDADALWSACREQTGTALEGLAQRLTPCFKWDDLVVSAGVRKQLLSLATQVEQRGRVYESWGFGAQLTRGRGITAMFAGQSGTGKTMAAEILAKQLRLDLYRIDLAGVVSKYVGETEQNLRRVFDAADCSGAILLFDEADALFGKRTEVRDSHDRYANLEINYLLQRMEDYAGLAILATNRRSALDAAFLRRLRFVIDFPFPETGDRLRIWEKVFPPQAPTEGLEWSSLARLDLSGGNIRSVAINAAFLAAAEGSPITMKTVMRAAAREYAKLAKPIGAAEFGPYHAVVQP